MVKKILELLTEHVTEHDFGNVHKLKRYKELKKRKEFSVPKIFHGGRNYDLKKRWYVYYSYRNPDTGCLERQDNIYFNVNRDYHTKKERIYRLQLIRDELEWLLDNGYSPYNDKTQNDYRTGSLLDFALEIKKQSLKQTSYKDYQNRLEHFKTYLERKKLLDTPISDITKKVVIDFLNELLNNSSARNRNNTRGVLSAIFGVLEDNEHIPRNFITNIKKVKADPERNKTYNSETVEEIFNHMDRNNPNLFFFVKVMSFCFLRPIEVCRLKVGDIDFKDQLLFVRAKNKVAKVKIIPDILMSELEHLKQLPKDYAICTPNGSGIWETEEINKRNYFSKQYKDVKDALGLSKDQTLYSFRHTYITKVYREFRTNYSLSESQDKLMLITGHSTIQALRNYLRDIDAELPADYSEMLK